MKIHKIIIASALVLGLAMPAMAVLAAEFIAADPEGSGNIVLPVGQNHKNLYVAGGSVSVDSAVLGDLFVAGGTITVNGPVEADVVVVGGTVILNAPVSGDVRAAGGTLQINSSVAGDVLLGGGTVNLSSKASVGQDLVVGAGMLQLDAPVGGSVKVAGGDIFLNSKVNGNVKIFSEDNITFGPTSDIAGKTMIKFSGEPVIKDGAKFASQPEIEKIVKSKWNKGFIGKGFWLGFLSSIFAALLLLWIFPRFVDAVVQRAHFGVGKNLATGLISAIVWPFIVIIAIITLLGLWAGLTFAFIGVALIFIVKTLTDLFFGAWLLSKLSGKKAGKENVVRVDWQAAVLGAAVLTLIGLIPIFGWLVFAALNLVTFGALLRVVWDKRIGGEGVVKTEIA